jgi:hypothetical protein
MVGRHGRPDGKSRGHEMDLDRYFGKTSATLEEIKRRVMFALDRHPLCRGIEFDVVSMPRNRNNNWTAQLRLNVPIGWRNAYAISGGAVLLDGIDLRSVRTSDLRQQMAYNGNGNGNGTAFSGGTDAETEFPFPPKAEFPF